MKLSWPSWLTKNVLGFSVASTMSDASHEIAPLVLPVLIAQIMGKDAAPPYVALIGGASTAVASLSGLYAGKISDHLANRKPLIVFGYFLTGALVGLLAFAQHWATVFILMTGAWIGRGLISAPRNAIIADSTEPAYYGRAFGFRQACDTIGSVLGPLMVYFLAGWPPQQIFLVTLVPGAIALFLIYFLIEDAPHTPSKKPFSSLIMNQVSLPQSFYTLMGVFFLFGLANFNKSLLVLRMQELLAHQEAASVLSTVTLLYVFRNIIQTFSSYLMGALSDTIGRTGPLAIGGFGFFGLMSLLVSLSSPSLFMAGAIFFLSGWSAGTYVSLQKSLAADVLPEEVRGVGYGIMTTLDSIAAFASSIIIGLLWRCMSPEIAFIMAAIISLISVACLLARHAHKS